jgi:DNA polymerase III epsilon subunit-like protein
MAGFPPLHHHTVDALALARQLLPGLGRYPQENVARVMGISSPVRHRALGDAMITARIFMTFSLMMKAYDLTKIADLGRKDLTPVLTTRRLEVIREAAGSGQALWIRYLSPTGNEITERVVSPKEEAGGQSGPASAAYLIGYCHHSRGERNFRVDRILDLRIVPVPQG